MLEISNLSSGYGKLRVINELDLKVPEGARIAIFGRNGAGKTTLMGTILRVVSTFGGDVTWRGQSLRGMRTEAVVRMGIGLVPQSRGIFHNQTVEENLLLGAFGAGLSRQARAQRVEEMFERFPNLATRRALVASSLSGGEQQMLAVAKVLMRRPKVLLLDEPSIGLAPRMIAQVASVLREVERDEVTVLITEQNVEWVLPLVDHVHILEQGRITETLDAESGSFDATTILHKYLGNVQAVS